MSQERVEGAGESEQAAPEGGRAQTKPLRLAMGAAAVGFLAGMLIPTTRTEDEKLGPMADDVKARARQTGRETLERGRQVALEAAGTTQRGGRKHRS